MDKEVKEKINESKINRLSKMLELSKMTLEDNEVILKKLGICYKTLIKWKERMKFVDKIKEVKLDRALKEMIFSDKSQIECFEYLIKDLNYFSTFDEVKAHVNITRYYYKIVKTYIQEELTKL